MSDGKSLLIYAPVPLHVVEGRFYLEDQACNGLRLWAQNFAKLIVMMPVDPGPRPMAWVPLEAVGPDLERIEIVPLPMAYRPDRFLRHLPASRRTIRRQIERADYMGFAIGGLFGDWGAVAAWEAHRMRKRFYIWADRVESEVVRREMHVGSWRRRLLRRLTHRPMAWLERFLIRRCHLGLFHGKETFDHYAASCRDPRIVHDIHIKKADHISAEALGRKVGDAALGPLRIVYVGRAEPMKGPMDWLDVCARLARGGLDFHAIWYGEGSEMARMQDHLRAAGLQDRVSLPGFLQDRAQVLAAMRDAQVFMFCHKTPESPRCLIEALVSGTPIVGYGGAFAGDLIAANQGGRLCAMDDREALAGAVLALARDRDALAEMMLRAARDGAPFDDEAVFRHRSDLIRACL